MTFKPGYNVLAHLRGVRRLVILAAPSCCGKTHFVRMLTRQASPNLARKFGLDMLSDWHICDAYELPTIRQRYIDQLLLCYAIPTHEIVCEGLSNHSDDPRLSIVSIASQVSFITLLESTKSLSGRLTKRRFYALRAAISDPSYVVSELTRLSSLKPIYKDRDQLETAYRWWFNYTEMFNYKENWIATSQIVDSSFGTMGAGRCEIPVDRLVELCNGYSICGAAYWNEVFRALHLDP